MPFIKGYEVRATKKREHVDQFKALLRNLYESDERMRGFKENPSMDDQHYSDPDNHVILAFDEGRVIGGLRMRISTPEYPLVLDMENEIVCPFGKERLHLQDLFPELDLQNYAYAEVSCVATEPEYRNGEVLQSLLSGMLDLVAKYHVRHVFAYSDLLRLRSYKKVMKTLGEEVHVCMKLPPLILKYHVEGLRMYMMQAESSLFRADSTENAESRHFTAA